MNARSPTLRLSLGLVALSCTILLSLDLLGIAPAGTEATLRERTQIVDGLAQQVAAALSGDDRAALRRALGFAVQRHDEVLSAGLRSHEGRLLLSTPEHAQLWQPDDPVRSSPTHARVALSSNGRGWGSLEVRFDDMASRGVLEAIWERPIVRLTLLLGVLGFVAYLLYLRRTLRHLDPSAVVPARVQAALDVMVEGVLLLDEQERVVLANAAFERRTGYPISSLLGRPASSLPWQIPGSAEPATSLPWIRAIRDSEAPPDVPLALEHRDTGEQHSFMVKGAPVLDGWHRAKGAIATFDDVTELERRTAELQLALAQLEKSQHEIRLQNQELETLARQDPLTGVSNRRHLLASAEPLFTDARARARGLCCVMVDIDHFKAVNDTHGHATGDRVIQHVAEAMTSLVPSSDLVCRYGGEEFLAVLPGADAAAAAAAADRLRSRIDSPGFARIRISASFGVSTIVDGAETFADLINQADAALYASKQRGRNRVTRYDDLDPETLG